MKNYMIAVGAAVAIGVVAAPTAAMAAKVPGNEGGYLALVEHDGSGNPVSVPVHRGETVAVTLGVAFNGNVSPGGAVVKVSVDNDLDLPHTFSNCSYFVNGATEGAWCTFGGTLQMGSAYALAGFKVAAADSARADEVDGVAFEVYRGGYGGAGGVGGLAALDAGPGTTPVGGTGGTLTLVKSDTLAPKSGPTTGFAPVRLAPVRLAPVLPPPPLPDDPDPAAGDVPSSSSSSDDGGSGGRPATKPASSPAAKPVHAAAGGVLAVQPPAAPGRTTTGAALVAAAATQPADRPEGGLATTGSKTVAVAGVGALLVVTGVLGCVVVARRRRRFTT